MSRGDATGNHAKIMRGISNISEARSKMTYSCMNGVWHKVRPNYVPDSQQYDTALRSIAETMTEIGKEAGLNDVDVA
jgi:hypothetical protein